MISRKFIYIFLFSICQLYVHAASLPKNPMGSGNEENAYSQEMNTDPMLERVIQNLDEFGTGNWQSHTQGVTPNDYWTYNGQTFLEGDTLTFSSGAIDSMYLSAGTYTGYLENWLIVNGVLESPGGGTDYIEGTEDTVPLEDSVLPLLILITAYSIYRYKKRKA